MVLGFKIVQNNVNLAQWTYCTEQVNSVFITKHSYLEFFKIKQYF